MKIDWRTRPKKTGKRWICPLLIFALAFGLILTIPGLSGEAKAIDLGKGCSLTVAPVDPNNKKLAADLEKADVVIDLYKVARAVPLSGESDRYTYEFEPDYKEMFKDFDILSQSLDNAGWQEMAQRAAGRALDGGTMVRSDVPANSSMDGLECGLYLLIARGRGISDYRTTVRQEGGGEKIATIADSGEYTYTFLPELISLPSKVIQNEDGSTINTMDGGGNWQYSMSVYLKPSQTPRQGAIEIIKTLESYETSKPATFVFQVEATLNGESVRSTTVSLTFTEAGSKSVTVDQIPIGAVVTVTEVYTGASYRLVSPGSQTVTIEAAGIVPVEFVNEYDETDKGGGAVTNHFHYDEEAGEWQWSQIRDSAGGE